MRNHTRTASAAATVGTLAWTAPEVLAAGARFSLKSDMYAFAVTTWEVFARSDAPFGPAVDGAYIVAAAQMGMRPVLPPMVPSRLARLVAECWHAEPAARPGFDEVVRRLQSLGRTSAAVTAA